MCENKEWFSFMKMRHFVEHDAQNKKVIKYE